MATKNPWLGLASYEEPKNDGTDYQFCGRDEETIEMVRLIDNNLFITLYGSSGIGKTSLLRAGVIPILRRKDYFPLYVRLSQEPKEISYAEAIVKKLQNSGLTVEMGAEVKHPDAGDRLFLWEYFATTRFLSEEREVYPVIILDQFEEVFREGDKAKAELLLRQIYLLLNDELEMPDETGWSADTNYRFVASIREDFLFVLEDSIDENSLDLYKNNRYRLRPMKLERARQVVLVPGKDCIEETEKETVTKRIIGLAKRPQSDDIDTLLLSLVCSGTYDKKSGERIAPSDLAVWKDNPMEVYYQDAVKGLKANQIRYIQQHFIREDGSRRRVDASEAKSAFGENTYRELTQGANRLLAIGDKGQVELLHDQLGMAVYEERKAFEERERKKKQRRRIALAGFIVLAIAGFFFFQNYKLQKVQWKMMENQARAVAEKANQLIDEGDLYTAITLCLEVLPAYMEKPQKPFVVEVEKVLRRADWELLYSVNTPIALFNVDQEHSNDDMDFGIVPQNKYVWTSTDYLDRSLRVYDINSGALLHESIRYGNLPGKKQFSSDGKFFVTNNGYYNRSSDGDETQIWRIEDGLLYKSKKLDGANNFEYFPNGDWIRNSYSTQMTFYTSDSLTKAFSINFWSDYDVIYERYLFYGDSEYMGLFDLKSNSIIYGGNHVGLGHFSSDAPYSHSDSLFVRIEDKSKIAIYDIKSGQLSRPKIDLDIDKLCDDYDIYISPNNDYIVVPFNYNGTHIKLFNLNDNSKKIIKVSNEDYYFYNCEFRFNLPFFLINYSNKSVFSVNIKTNQVVQSTLSEFYPEEMYLFVRKDKTPIAQLIRLRNNNSVTPYKTSTQNVIEFDSNEQPFYMVGNDKYYLYGYYTMPDSNYMIMHHINEEVYIYNYNNKKHKHIYTFRREIMNHWNIDKISNSDNFALTTSDSLYIIDYKKCKLVNKYKIPYSKIQTCVSSNTGKYVCISLDDSVCYIYDITSGEKTSKLNRVHCMNITFSPSDKIVACVIDKKIVLFDASNGKVKWMSKELKDCSMLNFSNDERLVACAVNNLTYEICCFDVSTGKTVVTLRGHTDDITSIDFSPQGDYLVSASEDGRVMLWNISEQQVVQTFCPNMGEYIIAEFKDAHTIKVSCYGEKQDYVIEYPFFTLQEIINRNNERFKNRQLTPEERRKYYLE